MEVKYPPGLADCFWHDVLLKRSGWLELKFSEPTDKEFKAGRIPKLRPAQPIWLNRQARRGVPAGILMRIGSEKSVWKLWVADGNPAWANLVNSTEAQLKPTVIYESGLDLADVVRELMRPHL
jgi:hypothetical protein